MIGKKNQIEKQQQNKRNRKTEWEPVAPAGWTAVYTSVFPAATRRQMVRASRWTDPYSAYYKSLECGGGSTVPSCFPSPSFLNRSPV